MEGSEHSFLLVFYFVASNIYFFPELGTLDFSGESHRHQRPFLELLQSLYSPNEHGSGRHVVPDTTVQTSKGPMVKKTQFLSHEALG